MIRPLVNEGSAHLTLMVVGLGMVTSTSLGAVGGPGRNMSSGTCHCLLARDQTVQWNLSIVVTVTSQLARDQTVQWNLSIVVTACL